MSIITPTIEMYLGDTSPGLAISIVRDDGTIVDITGATVLFKIKDPVTGLHTNDSSNTCIITNALAGLCSYIWNAGDLPDTGIYTANIKITYITGKVETSAARIKVSPII